MNKIVVLLKFNKVDLHVNNGARFKKTLGNKDWWGKRLEILKKITIPSLKNQTFKDFDIVAAFSTAIPVGYADEVKDYLKSQGVFIVWDYREIKDFVEPFGYLISKYYTERQDVENVILVNLDSDDFYFPTAMEEVNKIPVKDGQVYIFRNGYVYDIPSGKVARYEGIVPPPFYAITYTRKALSDADNLSDYIEHYNLRVEHPHLKKCKRTVEMPDNLFVYVFHDSNVTSSLNNPHHREKIKEEIQGEEKVKVLRQVWGEHYAED